MSNTKTVKKLTSINTTLYDIKDTLNIHNWKQLFSSHAINIDQAIFEQYHIISLVASGSVNYISNPEKGVEIRGGGVGNFNSGVNIRSTFRLPYLTKRMMVCFSHEVSVTIDIDVTNLVLSSATDTPTVASDGFGFLWNGDASEPLNIRFGSTNIAQASFNKDILDGTGPSGITLSRRDGTFTTFIIFDILVNKCVKYGIICNGNNYIVHEETNINDGVLTLPNSGQLYTSIFDVGGLTIPSDEIGYFRGWDVMGVKEINDNILDSRHPFVAYSDILSIAGTVRDQISYMRYKTSPVDITLRNVYLDKLSIFGSGLFEIRINYLAVATNSTGSSGGVDITPVGSQIEIFTGTTVIPDGLLNITAPMNDHVVYYEIANNYTNIDLKKIIHWYNFGFSNISDPIRTEIIIEITNLNSTSEDFKLIMIWRES